MSETEQPKPPALSPTVQPSTSAFSPSAPLVELVKRLGGDKSLAERVKLARWKRKRPAQQEVK